MEIRAATRDDLAEVSAIYDHHARSSTTALDDESPGPDRWAAKVGREDMVLIDRPGRGYGADYSPWLVDAPVGELVPVRGGAVVEEGILAA